MDTAKITFKKNDIVIIDRVNNATHALRIIEHRNSQGYEMVSIKKIRCPK